MRLLTVLAIPLALLPALPRAAAAQGETAIPLRSGTLRISLAPDWAHWNQRYAMGTPGVPDGSLEPLGADFSTDALGTTQLPFLAAAEAQVGALTGVGGYAFNLGRARLTLNNNVRVIPLGLELAVSRRLTLRGAVPLVRARVETYLLAPDSTPETQGNVGLNPGFVIPGTQDGFRTQVEDVLAALAAQAATGPAGLQAQAQALIASAQPLLCGVATLGAGSTGAGACAAGAASLVLPVTGSAAGDSLASRLASARSSYDALASAYAGQGVTLPAFDAAFVLPTAPVDSLGLRRLFSDPNGPLAGDSLTSLVRTRLGDIELGASYQLADRPSFRSQLAVTAFLPTGSLDSPDNFIDLPTGRHEFALEAATRNDFVIRRDFWVHVGGRFGASFGTEQVRRIAPANLLLAAIADTARVSRTTGQWIALDVVPNWQLDDAFGLGVGLHWMHQGATTYRYRDAAAEARVGLPASVLEAETGGSLLRIGAGATFSTLSRYAAHRASLPYDVTIAFQKAFRGSGGRTPAASAVSMTIRAYLMQGR